MRLPVPVNINQWLNKKIGGRGRAALNEKREGT